MFTGTALIKIFNGTLMRCYLIERYFIQFRLYKVEIARVLPARLSAVCIARSCRHAVSVRLSHAGVVSEWLIYKAYFRTFLTVWYSPVLRFFGMYPAMGVALYRRGVMDNLAR